MTNPSDRRPDDGETQPLEVGSAQLQSGSRRADTESQQVPDGLAGNGIGLALGSRYQFVSGAVSGGMGTVAEARDTLLDRRVAVKFLRRAGGATERATLIREARAMAALRHNAVCRVLEVVIDPPLSANPDQWRPFIVMEWVAGQPLSAAWKGMPFEKRMALFTSIVEGVAAMHALGLVHRDLKPSNILCDTDGNPVIVDFGLSARQGDEGEIAGGTPGWSAPEQFDAGSEVGPAADVFALGVLFYNMLTGAQPFDGASTADILKRTRDGDAPLPESIVPGIAAPLQRIALAAIDPDPAQRYADASLMLADIRRFEAGETVLARPRRLFTRFADEVERHLSDARRWEKQGLATEHEIQPIIDGLRVLQRPESPWVLDSRRLSVSQVSLYFGGWLVVLALTVGMWNTSELWRAQGASLPWLVPVIVAGAVTAIGLLLSRIGEQRTALGFLFTSTLAIPVATWQCMRTLGILGPSDGARDLFRSGEVGLSNNQQLVIAGSGLLVSLVYRFRTPSSAFTLMATVFGLWLFYAVGLRHFDLDAADRIIFGQMALWTLLACAVLVIVGVVLDGIANRPARDLLVVAGPRDGGPVLITALIGVLSMLTVLANHVPEWFWFGTPRTDGEGNVINARSRHCALAFLLTGAAIFGISLWLRSRPTPLRDWCARALRWIVPSYLLLPIVWLEINDSEPGWQFWMSLLAIVSVGLVAASSLMQWRPFLVSGLLGTADLAVRGFFRIEREFGGDSNAKLVLMIAIALGGIAVMFIASYPERVMRGAGGIARTVTTRLGRLS
jgi:serine/threonine protein kinase